MNEQFFTRLRAVAEARMGDTPYPAHDMSHVRRVEKNARRIAEGERAQLEVVVPAAILHELVNLPKDHPDSHRSGDLCADAAAVVLAEERCDASLAEAITACIRAHAFSKGAAPDSREAAILQDADRLDAIGAIGIARCMATCTEMRRPFYAPDDPFCRTRTPDDKMWGIDHFYKKLLVLEARFHTDAARAIAQERTQFLRAFLGQLEREV